MIFFFNQILQITTFFNVIVYKKTFSNMTGIFMNFLVIIFFLNFIFYAGLEIKSNQRDCPLFNVIDNFDDMLEGTLGN